MGIRERFFGGEKNEETDDEATDHNIDFIEKTEEGIGDIRQELERKKAELKDEVEFYRDARNKPRKSFEDESALDAIQNTRKKLEKEILELEGKIKRYKVL